MPVPSALRPARGDVRGSGGAAELGRAAPEVLWLPTSGRPSCAHGVNSGAQTWHRCRVSAAAWPQSQAGSLQRPEQGQAAALGVGCQAGKLSVRPSRLPWLLLLSLVLVSVKAVLF